jgi:hypothetical protein
MEARIRASALRAKTVSPIFTRPTGILLRTIYFPLELYAMRSGPVALDVSIESSCFETKSFGSLMYLDASPVSRECVSTSQTGE